MSSKDCCPVPSRKELINNEYNSDVKFIVGQDKTVIYGHKLLIELYSPVFFKILNSDFKERDTGSIEIEDIEPEIMLEVLKYMYTDKVSISKENLVPLYSASDKYMIDELNKTCLNAINLDNVLKVLQMNSENHNFFKLHEKCMEVIINDPIGAFEQDDFLALNKTNLELVLKQRFFKCTYNDLHVALDKWMKGNKDIPMEDLENEIHSYVIKSNLKKLSICGTWEYKQRWAALNLIALKDTNLVGVCIIMSPNDLYTSFCISINDTSVTEKDLQRFCEHDDILEVYFKKISIAKHSKITISCTSSSWIYTLYNADIRPNTYFKIDTAYKEQFSPVQYLIIDE